LKLYWRKKNVLDSFYSEAKTEILGFDDYLKLETTDAYKNNKQRIKRVQTEKDLGWIVYDDMNKKLSSEK